MNNHSKNNNLIKQITNNKEKTIKQELIIKINKLKQN